MLKKTTLYPGAIYFGNNQFSSKQPNKNTVSTANRDCDNSRSSAVDQFPIAALNKKNLTCGPQTADTKVTLMGISLRWHGARLGVARKGEGGGLQRG